MIETFIRNPVKVTVAVLMTALFGIIGALRMPMQLTPEVETPTLTVETRWPGASPQEVEQEIVQEQEEQLKSVEGLTKLSSESLDSQGRVTLEFAVGTNMEEALLKVNSRLQQVPEYPEDADQPVISTSNSSNQPIAWFILMVRPPTTEEIDAFAEKYPNLKEAVASARRTENIGLRVYRLRQAAKEHPEIERLLAPTGTTSDEHIKLFIEQNEELLATQPALRERLDIALSLPRDESRTKFIELLARDYPAARRLLPIDVTKMRRFTEDYLEAAFERVPGVSNSNVIGGLEDEIQVIVDPEQLASRDITIEDVRNVLRSQNKHTSGGDFWESKRRWVVRTLGQFDSTEKIEQQLIAVRDGRPVYIRDVAVVKHDFKKPDGLVRRYGESSIAVNCIRETGANVLDVMAGLKETTAQLNENILSGEGLILTQVYDETEYIDSAVKLVRENIYLGGALTMVVLMLFLHLGYRTVLIAPAILATGLAAVWINDSFFLACLAIILFSGLWFARGALAIGLAIPTSIVGTFLVLSLLGRTLNVISLAGLAFAVGMLVDNAVVVLENIYTKWQAGESPFSAAVKGTREVYGAVTSSTLTTVAVFLPVVFVQEEAGQLFRDIALAISAAVALSLVVSIVVVPVATARILPKHNTANVAAPPRRKTWLVGLIESGGTLFTSLVAGINSWLQRSVILRLLAVVSMVWACAAATILFWPAVEYLPGGNRNLVIGLLLPPPGYNIDQLTVMGEEVEEALKKYWDVDPDSEEAKALDGPPIGDFFFVVRGRQVFLGVKAHDMTRAGELVNIVQRTGARFPGTFAVAFQSSLFQQGLQGGRTVDVEITGPELTRLVELGGQVLGQTMGLYAPDKFGPAMVRPVPSLDLSSPEVHVEPKLVQAAEMGLTTSQIGYVVDALVDGAYATDYFIGSDKIDLMIRGKDDFARRTQDVESLPIATPIGQLVPLGAVAHVTLASGPEQVNHRERERAITIQFTPPPIVPLESAMAAIDEQIVRPLQKSGQLRGGYRIVLAGTADKLRETWNAVRFNVILAGLITYLLMAALYESWVYPFVIILSVPLGAVGGLVGLKLLGLYLMANGQTPQALDVLTMLGFIILIGTVVNNPILIVDQALILIREQGMQPRDAIVESVRSRIRPMMMTTVTTVLGLLPLVLFPGAGSELYRGLGSVVLGGLIFSTVLALFLIPSAFTLVLDAQMFLARMFGWEFQIVGAKQHDDWAEDTPNDAELNGHGTNGHHEPDRTSRNEPAHVN
jgi:HAE1 family hydrophobic/amphiphilic exporter-1